LKPLPRRSENSLLRGNVLSCTEEKVLDLLAKGLKSEEISKRLKISIHAVNTHIDKIHEKLAVRNEAATVAKVHEERLLPRTSSDNV
jgi:DNA-binding NarL/FixJ family response regulator